MQSYKTILIATDLSEGSKKVIARAKALTASGDAGLHLIHVIEHSPVAYGGEFSIPIDINVEQTIETHAREALAKLGDQAGISPDHQYLAKGSVKLAVKEKATDLNADLILIGTHEHHGLDWLLGSRANAILHFAPVDVLVVKV